MRRGLLLLAAILTLILTGCGGAAREDGIRLYYRDARGGDGHAPFGTADGVIGYERRAVSPATYDEMFAIYFAPPTDPGLESPFPKGLSCRSACCRDKVLTVTLSKELESLGGVDRSIASACLVYTLTQFDEVDGVCIQVEGGAEAPVLYARDFVLEDLGAVNTETPVRLYFSDSNGRYLVPAEQKHYFADEGQIPAYIIAQLIEGPSEQGQLAVIPEGAVLREAAVDEKGLCTVDFSSEFLLNKPDTDLSERMTVLSIVDSLTELPQIEQVRFLVEGQPVGVYYHMDLSRAYGRDESAIHKARAGLNETDATMYVGCWDEGRLVPVPVGLRENSQTSAPELLLLRLLNFEPVNDLSCPLPEKTAVQSLTVAEGVCRVDFSEEFLTAAGDASAKYRAVHAVADSLISLDEIDTVFITVNGSDQGFSYWPFDRGYTVED